MITATIYDTNAASAMPPAAIISPIAIGMSAIPNAIPMRTIIMMRTRQRTSMPQCPSMRPIFFVKSAMGPMAIAMMMDGIAIASDIPTVTNQPQYSSKTTTSSSFVEY